MSRVIQRPYQPFIASIAAAAALVFGALAQQSRADEPPTYNGPGGGEFTIERGDIKLVDGDGDWIIWGIGQDLTIIEKKDGKGSLTLHNFGKITINEKNGPGSLVIQDDNKSVVIKKVDGAGAIYLRNSGYKKIVDKNGPGNIYFRVVPPIIDRKDGEGKILREHD